MRVMTLRIFVCGFVDNKRQAFDSGTPPRVTSKLHVLDKCHESKRHFLRTFEATLPGALMPWRRHEVL